MVRTRQSTKRKADSDVNTAQPPADSPTQQKLPVRAKDNELLESKAPVKSAQGTLKVFDDDDDDDEVMTIGTAQTGIEKPAPAPAPEPESEEESDDDAAPEAVSTQHAASSIKMSAHTAQKAAQQYVQPSSSSLRTEF